MQFFSWAVVLCYMTWIVNCYPGFISSEELVKKWGFSDYRLLEKRIISKNFPESKLFTKKLHKQQGLKKVYRYYLSENDLSSVKFINQKSAICVRKCSDCGKDFLCVDSKMKLCKSCKEIMHLCACGCGQLVGKGITWVKGHHLKGKTYFEIHGTANPTCGFQRGENNIAKKDFIRRKISSSVKKSYTLELKEKRRKRLLENKKFVGFNKVILNSKKEKYRSSLEVKLSEIFIKHDVPYQYERRLRLIDNSLKVIDFIVFNSVVIEVTGFAFKDWRESFIKKMFLVRRSISNPILLITYPWNLVSSGKNSIYNAIYDRDTFCVNVEDEERIISSIKFCLNILKERNNSSDLYFTEGDIIYENKEKVYF